MRAKLPSSRGSSVLCSLLARGLDRQGAAVVVVANSRPAKAQAVADEIAAGGGGKAIALQADVFDRESLTALAAQVLAAFGRVDILTNVAGGAGQEATTSHDLSFFDLQRRRCAGCSTSTSWARSFSRYVTLLCDEIFRPFHRARFHRSKW